MNLFSKIRDYITEIFLTIWEYLFGSNKCPSHKSDEFEASIILETQEEENDQSEDQFEILTNDMIEN